MTTTELPTPARLQEPEAGRSQRRPHLPPTLVSVLASRDGVLTGLGLLMIAVTGLAAYDGGQVLLVWDEPLQRFVEANRHDLLNQVFLVVTRLGDTEVVVSVALLAGLASWRRCRVLAAAFALATFGRLLLEAVLKLVVGRERPGFTPLVEHEGFSFPSGHVLAAVALWGMLPGFVGLFSDRQDLWRASVAVSAVVILAVSASRVYLGVHWSSDLAGGLAVGFFFLVGVEAATRHAHRDRPCRSPATTRSTTR